MTGALRDIATADGAAIVHCAAGKDRTGVIVALALTVAEVEPDAIVADYVATDDRIEAILDRLRRSRMYAKDLSERPVQAHLPRAGDDAGVPRAAGRPVRRPAPVAGRQRLRRRRVQPAPRQAQGAMIR